jgi:hypothetical protein
LHHHTFGVDTGLDLTVGSHRQAIPLESNTAFDLAVDIRLYARHGAPGKPWSRWAEIPVSL